jgi:hypothetical protein
MNSEDARQKLESLKIAYSSDNFFKYVQSGDREVVELFLDAGLPPNLRDGDRQPAVLVATKSGRVDIARLLLNRGASPEPLLDRPPQGKDKWDKILASSGLLNFISGILIAAVGGYFTYSYNQRQIDLNRTQSEHDASTKEQSNKVLELEAVQKLIPTLASKDEKEKATALVAIQDLAHPQLAADLAVLFKGEGSVQYLKQAASSGDPDAKQTAVRALSTIVTSTTGADSQLASRALSDVFESTRASVVRIEVVGRGGGITAASGVIVSSDGYILTISYVVGESANSVSVLTTDSRKLPARVVNLGTGTDFALLRVESAGLTPVRLAKLPPAIGSTVIGIGFAFGRFNQSAYVGTVSSIDKDFIHFIASISLGTAGGPILTNTGEVAGLMSSFQNDLATAVPSYKAIAYLRDVTQGRYPPE